MSEALGEHGISSETHAGLSNLHAHQEELAHDPTVLRPAKVEAFQAKPTYVFKSALHVIQIMSDFEITAGDVDRVIDHSDPENPVDNQVRNGIVRGQLKAGVYRLKKGDIPYRMTKAGANMMTTYTFERIQA